MGKRIVRLEQGLRLWEDLCFLTGNHFIFKLSESNPRIKNLIKFHPDYKFENDLLGPIRHYKDYRKHLVKKATEGDYDYERFTGSYQIENEILMDVGPMPMSLFSWNHNSRRVFNLSSEMQTLFSATSLERLTWQDIKWPFKSFLLTLEEPLVNSKGNSFDSILVSEVAGIVKGWEKLEIFNFHLFSSKLDEYKPVEKEKISKMIRRGNYAPEKMGKKIIHLGRSFVDTFHITTKGQDGFIKEPLTKPCRESFNEFKRHLEGLGFETGELDEFDEYETLSIYDKAKHLVLSTCLYLETLPPKKLLNNNQSEEKRREAAGEFNLAAITTADDIFNLVCESTLSRESQEIISEIKQSRISREKRPHWRRGHWRRFWGGKNNPYSPRIWIFPCLVNLNRLPPQSLPIASRVMIEG